jgi:CPA2 family monovalent cation:H+ antiporter-2
MISAGLIDFIVNFGLGFALGVLAGLNIFYSLVLAGAVYMSSSGIVTKSLLQLQASKNPEGMLIMGIMVFEDLVMIIFLALISSGLGSDFNLGKMFFQLGKSLIFCAVIVVLSRTAKKALDKLVNIKKGELLLIIFFALVLLITSVGELFGVSAGLSAFFLGMAFSNVEKVKNIEQATVTFRDLFGSVFFFPLA